MAKFRKKQTVVEAFQVGSDRFYPDWLHDAVTKNIVITHAAEGSDGWGEPFDNAHVMTLHGLTHAKKGDWIIRGVAGDFWPCDPLVFEQSYEPAD